MIAFAQLCLLVHLGKPPVCAPVDIPVIHGMDNDKQCWEAVEDFMNGHVFAGVMINWRCGEDT